MSNVTKVRNELFDKGIKGQVKDLKDLMSWVNEQEQFLADLDKRMAKYEVA